jgi:hypothetical protein
MTRAGPPAARSPAAERGTLEGAKANIARHYDLSDDLFVLFLDPTMTYSSAVFGQGDTLAAAQQRKIAALLDLTSVGPGSTVLEIGTGWGELALQAAARGGTGDRAAHRGAVAGPDRAAHRGAQRAAGIGPVPAAGALGLTGNNVFGRDGNHLGAVPPALARGLDAAAIPRDSRCSPGTGLRHRAEDDTGEMTPGTCHPRLFSRRLISSAGLLGGSPARADAQEHGSRRGPGVEGLRT